MQNHPSVQFTQGKRSIFAADSMDCADSLRVRCQEAPGGEKESSRSEIENGTSKKRNHLSLLYYESHHELPTVATLHSEGRIS
eukprot:3933016-Rhodomonas_salina.3